VTSSKTNDADYGMLSSGPFESFHPRTPNPWDPQHNPGGSQFPAPPPAGAAGLRAAVILRHRPSRLGAGCRPGLGGGLVGLKPSLGQDSPSILPYVPGRVGRTDDPPPFEDAALI